MSGVSDVVAYTTIGLGWKHIWKKLLHDMENIAHSCMETTALDECNCGLADKRRELSSSSSCGLSRAGRCRSYELAPCLSILRSVVGGC